MYKNRFSFDSLPPNSVIQFNHLRLFSPFFSLLSPFYAQKFTKKKNKTVSNSSNSSSTETQNKNNLRKFRWKITKKGQTVKEVTNWNAGSNFEFRFFFIRIFLWILRSIKKRWDGGGRSKRGPTPKAYIFQETQKCVRINISAKMI